MNRVSKIARLPRPVREQLNQSLDDCMPSAKILAWLNSLPEAKAILANEFAGAPITKGNLTEEQKRLALLESSSDEELEKLFWEWTTRPEIRAKLYPQRSRDEARREAERVLNFKLLGIPYEAQLSDPSLDEYADPAALI